MNAVRNLSVAVRRHFLPSINGYRGMSGAPLMRPSPPPLPPKDQKEFEELVRAAVTPAAAPLPPKKTTQVRVEKGEELHPDARRPLPDEFEGDVNPVTGERGGPKREPLRHGDWSYGGRATDF
ncbi:hypothetical protein BD410DRAFT_785601 [Rickenella mellea]|uniref:Succinate dehydrogenase assembly factor 4, mitochondrial n=1 Tax=Rickenella mellea TaxID=50990 RepID=A0A4Y7QBW8_9AGAM|nr:hypothetical protein BD410DRAFT_785601 [Rickenella mellea]